MFFKVDFMTNIKQVSTREIPFPAVTICSPLFSTDDSFNISKVIKENLNISDCRTFAANSQKCPLKIAEHVNKQCNGHYTLESATKSIENSSMEVTKLIKNCSWRERVVDCEKMFNPILTENGICYSFNMQSFGSVFNRGIISDEFKFYKRTKISKSFNTSDPIYNETHTDDEIVELWTPDEGFLSSDDEIQPARGVKSNEIEFSLTLSDSEAFNTCDGHKFSVILHKPNEMPTQFHKIYKVDFNKMKMIKINGKLTKTDSELKFQSIQKRNCLFKGEKTLKYFNSYTKAHCDLECLANFTWKKCQCVKFSMPRSDSTYVCDLDRFECMHDAFKTWNLQTNDECDCYQPCNDVQYWINEVVDLERLEDAQIPQGSTASTINLKFDENFVLEYEKIPATRIYNFLGEFGGLLALFLGCSLLSIIELFQFVLGAFFRAFKKIENDKKVSHTAVVDFRKPEHVFLQ